MSQSRIMSGIEAATNVVAGFGLAICVQLVAFPAFGLNATPRQHLALGAIFTAVSLARSYLLRRVFNRLGRT